jgi:molecular chaperone DnaK
MVKEAEAHAEEDRRRRALVEARNRADAAIASAERALAEGKGDTAARSVVEKAIAEAKTALAGDSVSEIDAKAATLAQFIVTLDRPADVGAQPASDDGVVDAEFEEVDSDRH